MARIRIKIKRNKGKVAREVAEEISRDYSLATNLAKTVDDNLVKLDEDGQSIGSYIPDRSRPIT